MNDASLIDPTSVNTLPVSDAKSTAIRRASGLHELHLAMLAISLTILAAAFILQPRAGGSIGLAFLPNVNLPALCGSRALFGIECPGCGLTHSIISLASGNLAASLAYHRLGWFVALAVVLQIPYRLYCLHELRTKIPTRVWAAWFGYSLVAALVINWLLKVSSV